MGAIIQQIDSLCSCSVFTVFLWDVSARGLLQPAVTLKGLSHEMYLAFEDIHGQLVLGLKRGRCQFLNFLGGTMVLKRKKCISRG
jgi:hypothetical protein